MAVSAGALKDKLSFQKRGLDANGDPLGEWEEAFKHSAYLFWRTGTEPVVAQRLEGQAPVEITVREDSFTRQITSGWRAVGVHGFIAGKVFEMTSPPARSKTAGYLQILAAHGGANA